MAHTKNNRTKRTSKVRLPAAVKKYKVAARARGWDPKRTAIENAALRGVVRDPNAPTSLQQARAVRLTSLSRDEVLEMVDGVAPPLLLGTLAERNSKRGEFFMKQDEVDYLGLLVSKYGANYVAMSRDMKVNYLQHSAAHLETRCTRLAKLMGGGAGAAAAAPAAAAAAAAGRDGMAVEGGGAAGRGRSKGGAPATGITLELVEDDGFADFAKKGLQLLRKPKLR
jgi:hypothetical protein